MWHPDVAGCKLFQDRTGGRQAGWQRLAACTQCNRSDSHLSCPVLKGEEGPQAPEPAAGSLSRTLTTPQSLPPGPDCGRPCLAPACCCWTAVAAAAAVVLAVYTAAALPGQDCRVQAPCHSTRGCSPPLAPTVPVTRYALTALLYGHPLPLPPPTWTLRRQAQLPKRSAPEGRGRRRQRQRSCATALLLQRHRPLLLRQRMARPAGPGWRGRSGSRTARPRGGPTAQAAPAAPAAVAAAPVTAERQPRAANPARLVFCWRCWRCWRWGYRHNSPKPRAKPGWRAIARRFRRPPRPAAQARSWAPAPA